MVDFIADHQHRLAEAIRTACIEAALAGYESASISGLCREGAWEAAISAIRMADLDQVIVEWCSQAETPALNPIRSKSVDKV